MSEDAHSSGDDWTPKQFQEWLDRLWLDRLSGYLGRWEELTLEDLKLLYECGVSCE